MLSIGKGVIPMGRKKRRRAKKNRKYDPLLTQELAILTVVLSLLSQLIEIIVNIITAER